MMKTILTSVSLLAVVLLTGCSKTNTDPRLEGTILSHVDAYGSGTGSESLLHREGSMMSGFDYGDSAKPDWSSDIKWRFVRRQSENDVYQIEWAFRPKNGASGTQTTEVSFDGKHTTHVFGNRWQAISIEPKDPPSDPQAATGTNG